MPLLISGRLCQRQLSLCMLLMALAQAPVGNAQRFPAARPREAGFLWAGGRSPAVHQEIRARAGAGAGGVWGGSDRCGFRFVRHSGFRRLGPEARSREFEDDAVVDQPVNGRRRSHGVLENPVLLGEHQVGGDDDGPALVAFGQEGEQDLHLVPVLLDIPNIINDNGVEGV